jgi:hypothetical protein
MLRQEFANDVTDHRRTTEATTNEHFKSNFALSIADEVQADVMNLRCRAILRRTRHRDLELAR